jgi:hypothetical protein
MIKSAFVVLFGALTLEAQELDKFGWIAGCWQSQSGPLTIDEQWMRPAGGLMLGIGRTVRNGKAVFHEFLSISVQDGNVVYTARIGASSTPFKLVKSADSEAVFENPAHDFPQRIIYRKRDGGLHARIEGVEKGKSKSEDFPMRRVSCP